MSAIQQGDEAMVKVLLLSKANPNARTKSGDTPLKMARNGDLEEIVKLLKAAGAKVRWLMFFWPEPLDPRRASRSRPRRLARRVRLRAPYVPPASPASPGTRGGGPQTLHVGPVQVPLSHAYAVVVRPAKATADQTRILLTIGRSRWRSSTTSSSPQRRGSAASR